MAKYFDEHVRIKQFAKGYLVLKKVDAVGRSASIDKLNPNWDGPYIIKETLRSVDITSKMWRDIPSVMSGAAMT
ncbi:hypothetical protein KSP40_PGU001940 [Platanthera guangdongensis]|uniref:Uncharacterized protein n=1 Tax=Platanthera guangdongensis TaxID=2320717 RepID=A0ABR2LE67_9ASPA